jgi:hypothetical protein
MIFTMMSILFVYLLARQMYNENIATAAILMLLVGFPFPLIYGRQAIGEPAMIFYLVAGFYCFGMVLVKRSAFAFAMCIILWGAALTSKNQTLPFWTLSMITVLVLAVLRRDVFSFWASAIITTGTLIAWQGMLNFQAWLETGLSLYDAPMKGLLLVTGWVPVLEIRLLAWAIVAKYALPLIPALGYSLYREVLDCRTNSNPGPLSYLRWSYWLLTTSWFLWYVTMAMSWDRYLYPITFTGSIFFAVLLEVLTSSFSFSRVIAHASDMLSRLHIRSQELKAVLGIVLLCYMGVVAVRNFASISSNTDAENIANYLNTATPSDALLETYDSELLFLVQRRFHFPPDQIQVDLNRRTFLNQNINIDYDPRTNNPDYIVIGPFGKLWMLYDNVVAQHDSWHLVYEVPTYRVYEHIR